ncbi:uncharacterized protein LOC101456201 isoform X1 [Ceratitis capitata]|uniref:Uncharacterized protein n=2 Tax=Ceratitis capitata TaxID=7213 RepID=W8AUA5_CERCA|nr:uncharacterized protein LOC101456201 isoform X1 [Ceratitis capitata]
MSGLEKFQANNAWRAKVKKLLYMQRTLTPSSNSSDHCDRFSLDLEEDLQVVLETKASCENGNSKILKNIKANSSVENMFKTGNDENVPMNSNETACSNNLKKPEFRNFSTMAYCDESIVCVEKQKAVEWQRSSDESFMALEKMCDKTASDPDSTLFQYIHSEDKELIVEDVKKRSGDYLKTPSKKELIEIDEEAKSLQRLLHDLCVQEQKQLENETPLKGVDVTQLDDIEAPSKLWETTIIGESTLQTSPVKMVGLLRPSTIIEECCEDESNNSMCNEVDLSSHASFKSALKGSETSATSYYDTAHETSDASGFSKVSRENDKQLMFNKAENLDESLELIQLDKTLGPTEYQLPTAATVNSEEDIKKDNNNKEDGSPTSSIDDSLGIIELLSDDESDELAVDSKEKRAMSNQHIKTEFSLTTKTKLKDIEHIVLENCYENNKENCGGDLDESGEQSLHFNDTMEEVEYMMKKGMQYMAATETANTVNSNVQSPMPPTMTVKPLKERERTFTYSPKKQNSNYSSPSKKCLNVKPTAIVTGTKAKHCVSSPKRTPLSSAEKSKQFLINFKPMPKLNLFKKPTSAIPTRLKEVTGSKQFSHIVSPVGAYMKKTATTPLMSNLKQRSERPDVHNATVFRELEQETRVYQPKFALTGNAATKTSSLPKKAYISSEFKHITDERTPVTIPGGKKIQKYLENAMLPTVVRHEGKLKMSANEAHRKAAANKANFGSSTQRNNGSLANLSLMSGDISVYTMKDARKF